MWKMKYSACHDRGKKKKSKSPTGLEPMTSQTPGGRSNHLSYTEASWRARPYTGFIFTVLAPSAKTTNNDHVVSCEYTKPLVMPHKIQWSQKKKQSPAWYGNNWPKLQLSLYNHLEVHSRWYMILWNRRAYSFSNIITGAPGDLHCRCLTKIASIRRSVFGQIENRKPPEHSCLLNKL